MRTSITNDIKVMVETAYQNDQYSAFKSQHMFAYRISIVNQGDFTIRLLRRHWHIIDSVFGHSEVEGEGVVGLQPILEPGETHQYVSGCSLSSPIGKMFGTYLMERQLDGKQFTVEIPEFVLQVPYLSN
jgi:ApaG protein